MTHLEKAMRAVCVEYFGMDEDILTTELPHVVEIAKRELEKAVPAKPSKTQGEYSRFDAYNDGHNECRKLMGLE